MTINTKYNCLDKVYAIVNNKIRECSIRKISFCDPSIFLPNSIAVFYHILPLESVKIYDDFGIQEPESSYTIKRDNELGFTKAEKKLTYEEVARELFSDNDAYYINNVGEIQRSSCWPYNVNNCTSQRQAEKLIAINKLMNVAKYLNGDWQPDWDNSDDEKWTIKIEDDVIGATSSYYQYGDIYFKSEELAKKAIEILGEETIRLALCTDY